MSYFHLLYYDRSWHSNTTNCTNMLYEDINLTRFLFSINTSYYNFIQMLNQVHKKSIKVKFNVCHRGLHFWSQSWISWRKQSLMQLLLKAHDHWWTIVYKTLWKWLSAMLNIMELCCFYWVNITYFILFLNNCRNFELFK